MSAPPPQPSQKLGPITQINFITSNAHKLAEVQAILGAVEGVELRSKKLDLVEAQGASIAEIAGAKCRSAAELVSLFTFWFSG